MRKLTIRLEFKLEDMWIGAFWIKNAMVPIQQGKRWRRDIWICIVPMFPVHVIQVREVKP